MKSSKRYTALDIDSGVYVMSAKGNGYARRKVLEHFIKHVDSDLPPPRELLVAVADLAKELLPKIKNKKGFHENDFQQYENACEVFEYIKAHPGISDETACLELTEPVLDKSLSPDTTSDALIKQWRRFKKWISAGELPPLEELGEIAKQ